MAMQNSRAMRMLITHSRKFEWGAEDLLVIVLPALLPLLIRKRFLVRALVKSAGSLKR